MSPYSQWPSYSSLVQPDLVREVEILAGLQLPPANSSSAPSNSIERYVGDAISTGAIVTHDTRNLGTHRPLGLQGDIAYSNQGSKYQHSLPESLSSGNNNSYYPSFQSPTESSSGSLEEDGHRPQSSLSPSPEYFMSRAGDPDAPVDPSLAPSNFVCPKLVHISNGDGQEGHTEFVEDEENDYGCQQTMPTMFHTFYDRHYYFEQPPPPMEPYTQQHDHSPKHDHSCSSAQGSRQNSPTRALKLKANKSRRSKCPPGMMKPFAASPGEGEKPRKARGGEKPRGRGAGKKPKERKVCRDHPGKVFNHASDFKKHMNQQHLRPFLCVFYFAGCEQTFGSKNEWKRHVNSQHLQISYWHCDDDLCADRKAIFNRKDLFGQHLKRMHPAPEGTKSSTISYMELVIDRCRVERRKPPQESRCGYCKQQFSGEQGWEQRMEHVGQHYEKNNYKDISRDCWVPDEGLIAWALKHSIIEHDNKGGYTIVSTGKEAIVKAGVEQKKLARVGYTDDGDDDELDYDAEGDDDDYMHT